MYKPIKLNKLKVLPRRLATNAAVGAVSTSFAPSVSESFALFKDREGFGANAGLVAVDGRGRVFSFAGAVTFRRALAEGCFDLFVAGF